MRHLLITLTITALFCTTSFSATKGLRTVSIKDASGNQVGLYKKSHALIIGVADYTSGWPKLPGVTQETKQVEIALKNHGFNVVRIINPNDRQLKLGFEDFIKNYGYDQDNRLLFFFSGHGYSRNRDTKGYLVPVNAPDPRNDEKGFLQTALPMSQILAWCRQMEAKHALFLFDSCFSGTVFKTKALPKVPPHISSITSRPVRQFISAGDAGEEVPAQSIFTPCFLRALRGDADLSRDGYITGSELGMYLRDKVLYYSKSQTPQYGKIRDPDLDEGDFVFIAKAGSHPVAIAKKQSNNSTHGRTLHVETVEKSPVITSVSARHILVKDAKTANLIRKKLLAGYKFEDAAREYSICPSKQNGGNLGKFKRGMMVPEFEAAAFRQQPGEIGSVVKTKFGYHLIQVIDKQ